jgi:hypothetical protein
MQNKKVMESASSQTWQAINLHAAIDNRMLLHLHLHYCWPEIASLHVKLLFVQAPVLQV